MGEDKITAIEFPAVKPPRWGGVPVSSIRKFYNCDMRGYTLEADFDRLTSGNISDVQSCGVTYQRYFKDDIKQQRFLDTLYAELGKR